ncbi:MAG: FG-GAP-like repeat-containing protein, partial [Microcoleaceae cyanobacterium MO_207.B10]|nr:FG-GAP-like repeat-containing protein [Microcoleaceae cyanobacterium MO_207.B10]
GCNVAAGDAGAEFVAKLRGLTGANIAASASLTGAAVKGGNWELEVRTGRGKLKRVLHSEVMANYDGVLSLLRQWFHTISAYSTTVETDGSNVFVGGSPQAHALDLDGDGIPDLTGGAKYVAKFNNDGGLLWAKDIATQYSGVLPIAPGSDGGVFVAGVHTTDLDIDGNGSIDVAYTANSGEDTHVAKFDINGDLVWAKSMGGSGRQLWPYIASDNSGNLFVTGYFTNEIDINGDGSNELTALNSTWDPYVAKFDSDGNFKWAKNIGGSAPDYGRGIATDKSSGDVLAVGVMNGDMDIDKDGNNDLAYSGSGTDIYVAKFDTDGNLLWAESFSGSAYDGNGGQGTLDVVTDNNSNVFISGHFKSDIDIDGDGKNDLTYGGTGLDWDVDSFVAKFDSAGKFLWAESLSGSGHQSNKGIATDNSGNVFISGNSGEAVDIDGDGNNDLAGGGYIVKFDSDGTLLSAEQLGSHPNIVDLDIDSSGNILAIDQKAGTRLGKYFHDYTPPTVEAFNPNYDPNYVAPAANLVIEFNEKIQKATGNIVIKQASDNSIVETIDIVSSQVIAYGKTLTINPTADLANETGYYVEIAPGAIQDIAGHDYAGISDNSTWNFRTTTPIVDLNFTDSEQSLGDSYSRDVSLADLDGDGDVDAFVANFGQANKVWENDGSGNFTDSGQSLGNNYSYGVSLADLDGDGDVDAFVANHHNQPNKVWENDGSGNFTDSGQSLGSSNSLDVRLADLDGDGDVDAFVANHGQAHKVWENDGSGNFTDSGQSLGNNYSYGVSLADLDGDGDTDAFVANYDGHLNKVWLNDGSGNFTDSGQSLGDGHSRDVSLADLDGDGDVDAFVANRAINKVWENDGSGNFTPKQSLGNSSGNGVSLADLDADGDVDAFVASDKVWENDGSGNFTDSGQSLSFFKTMDVSLADLDGDGDVDAFFANDDNQANKVWFNERPNSAPTAVSISNNSIDENLAANSVVGTLSTTDPDDGDTFTYELVAGTGDTDNTAFTIDSDRLKINASPDYESQSTYNIRVQTTDAAGATHAEELTININDLDDVAPTVATFTPTDDATDIAVGENLVIDFDEDIVAGTGNIVIKQLSDNSTVETIDVTSNLVTISNNTVTIDPTADLAAGTDYYVEIAPGAIEDTSGNDYAGITDNTTWNFTTVADNNSQPVQFDFNSDGVADILWHNGTTGDNQIWLMNNDGTTNTVVEPGNLGTDWKPLGVEDFNSDGITDILWRNSSTGDNQIWLMNANGTRNTDAAPGPLNSDFQVEGLADFNSDGTPDILWRNPTTGANRIWLMNNDGTRNTNAYPGPFNSDYQVEVVADFNSDTTPDILWRNPTTGANRIWLMDTDGTRLSVANPDNLDSSWSVIGDDFSLI